jgi:hypothetical protein
MLIAFCCCWPYEAPFPDEGTSTPIVTSALAGTAEAAANANATRADRFAVQLLNIDYFPLSPIW